MWITFTPKVSLWTWGHWSWAWTITQTLLTSITSSSDKWNRFYKLPCTNNAFGLLVVLPCRAERSICLLNLKDTNSWVFLHLIQSVPFFLLWVTGLWGTSVCHFNHWFMKAAVWFRTLNSVTFHTGMTGQKTKR